MLIYIYIVVFPITNICLIPFIFKPISNFQGKGCFFSKNSHVLSHPTHLTQPFNPNLHPYPLHTYYTNKYPFLLPTLSFSYSFLSSNVFCFILLFIFSILSTYSFSILYPINLLTLIPSSSLFYTLSPNQITLILSLNLLCFILYLCYHYGKNKRIYIKETNH